MILLDQYIFPIIAIWLLLELLLRMWVVDLLYWFHLITHSIHKKEEHLLWLHLRLLRSN